MVNYRIERITNANGKVVKMTIPVIVRAIGAGYQNAFVFEFPGVSPRAVHNVSGNSLKDYVFSVNNNGTEANQNDLNVNVFDDGFNVLDYKGSGTGINVDPSQPYVQPDTLTIEIDFMDNNGQFAPGGPVNESSVMASNFKPYLIADVDNSGRGREIHLPGKFPTDLAANSYFNTIDDDTDKSAYTGTNNQNSVKSYKSVNNYPWALDLYGGFDYMIEKKDIVQGYLKFADWVEKGSNPNWYIVNNGAFRNSQYIY